MLIRTNPPPLLSFFFFFKNSFYYSVTITSNIPDIILINIIKLNHILQITLLLNNKIE